jgi:sensor histidine kinase YesM
VHERLQVLFGQKYQFQLDSKADEGTRIRIQIPG